MEWESAQVQMKLQLAGLLLIGKVRYFRNGSERGVLSKTTYNGRTSIKVSLTKQHPTIGDPSFSFTQVAVCLLSWSLEKIFVIIIIIMRALPLSYPWNLIAISDKKRSGRGFYRKFVYSSRAKGKRVLILWPPHVIISPFPSINPPFIWRSSK